MLLNAFLKHLYKEVKQLIDHFHHQANQNFVMVNQIEDYYQQHLYKIKKKHSICTIIKNFSYRLVFDNGGLFNEARVSLLS